jgi:putative hydrolase of the HAD superfamily
VASQALGAADAVVQRVDRRLAALLFDFGGTLDGPGLTWKTRAFRLYRSAGLATEPGDFDPVFYAADDALVGTVPASLGLDETARRLFAGISAGLGVADRGLTERLADRFVEDARASLRESSRVLARLARRHRLGIVSNFYGNLGAVCADAGLTGILGAITDSTVVGWTKPDPRIFRHALEALGVSPAETAFVGDSRPRDMEGARALAMPHVWLVDPEAAPGSPCCPGDPVIRSLDELEGVLA